MKSDLKYTLYFSRKLKFCKMIIDTKISLTESDDKGGRGLGREDGRLGNFMKILIPQNLMKIYKYRFSRIKNTFIDSILSLL